MSPTYSRKQVAEHKQAENGWFIINNGVYDVSKFYDEHPGGRDVLIANIGADATESFEAVHHSKSALRRLEQLKVGELPENESRCFISMKKVAEHISANSAWMVIHNKVYDLTKFLDLHPGGRDILLYSAGGDATQAFMDKGHSDSAHRMMEKYFIGDIEPSERRSIIHRKDTSNEGGADKQTTHVKSDKDSLLRHVQQQLKVLIILALFLSAAILLLR
ncbi:hypothetical protein JKF63_07551 [Porcisia hertigi]|uniref:Cytochrome b5 heme-binding domain-containing protein n=1 Tax=Porcisia hertigi TaxID=2761500 RepID=A0A836YH07_9TRYP|nr:hypothetical protein JKF63_07551 [Porcisia hertigi]